MQGDFLQNFRVQAEVLTADRGLGRKNELEPRAAWHVQSTYQKISKNLQNQACPPDGRRARVVQRVAKTA